MFSDMHSTLPRIRATTILAVRRDGKVALGGDGQVTVGDTVMKSNAQKVRALRGGQLLAGFAGSAADAFTLFEKFEEKLERYPNNLSRAAVELAKDWRSDRVLRRLEALLVVVDRQNGFVRIIRPGRSAGAGLSDVDVPGGDRAARPRDRRRDLRVHEHEHHGARGAGLALAALTVSLRFFASPDAKHSHAAGGRPPR
jgi:hypothetical protein